MKLSAEAILFGLQLLEDEHVDAEELAEALRETGALDAADPLTALQERLAERSPTLSGAIAARSTEARYVPVECRGCRAGFRAPPGQVDPDTCCPLCGEPIMSAGTVLLAGPAAPGETRARAAETGPAFQAPAVRRFAHFDLLRLLGHGGAGKVYEAQNRRAGRRVAVKLLDFQPLEPAAESFRKLRREARAAAAVAQKNIVPVFDLGIAEGVPFIEMELVGGTSLRERVRDEGLLEAGTAVGFCAGALRGLAAVHEVNIVHADVKPGNILIDAQGCARVTDFGLARFLEETTAISSGGKAVGSPHFMAPEQWRGESLSPRTDVYAMGLVLYFALTGRLPYEGENAFTLMYRHLHEPLLRPGADPYPISDYLAQVIRRATAKAPDDRFPGASAFADALWECDECGPDSRPEGS